MTGDAQDQGALISTSPTTGETLGRFPFHSPDQVQRLLDEVRHRQQDWAARPIKERARVLLRVGQTIVADKDELAATIATDSGKTRVDAMVTEVVPGALAAYYFARVAPRVLAERKIKPATKLLSFKASRVIRLPLGVVGVISPWNYPLAIPLTEVLMALVAGNGVILKTSSQTPLVGQAIEQVLTRAGVPPGLFARIELPGPQAGKALLQSGIDKLFFTGSVRAGQELATAAAQSLTPVNLELGGNDPMLVCPDADLERAAAGAVWAGLQNAGQSCGGVERIYVHQDVADQFLALLGEKVRALRVGPDKAHDVDIGAMTTRNQLELVQKHLDDALAKGAQIFAQSPCPTDSPGQFLPATVLSAVDQTMLVMQTETFGPLLPVMTVKSMDRAVELANDSDLGLTASVWSRHRRGAEKLGRRIRAGVVTINDHLMTHGLPEIPWGGFKKSGIGRTHGELGLLEMTAPQALVHDLLPKARRQFWWHPHGPAIYQGTRGLLDLLYAASLGARLRGLAQLLRLVPGMFR